MSEFSSYAEQYPPLDKSYQEELVAKAVAGNKAASDLLVLHNNRLVLSRLKLFQIPLEHGNYPEDLVHEAMMSIMHAIEKFDPSKGVKFSTYASHWIDQTIHLWLFRRNEIYLPRYLHDLLQNVKRLQREERLNREQVEARLKQRPKRISNLKENLDIVYGYLDTSCLSMDWQDTNDKGEDMATFGDQLADVHAEDAYEVIECQDELESQRASMLRLMQHILTPREREVFSRRYGIGCAEMSITDMAIAAQISRQRIDQVLKAATRKIEKATGVSLNSRELRSA